MKKNLFKLFTDKLLDYPIWVKQAVFRKLYFNLKENGYEKRVIESPEKIFVFYEPVITYDGENELKNKKFALDNNIYNFLKLCRENYNILEIALNTFLSLEETAKLFMFCMEQNYIEYPKNKEVFATCGFIAGKFRTGEYFKEKGLISPQQLEECLKIQKTETKPIGEILTDLNLISKTEIKNLFTLKFDAKKRFILDSAIYPTSELQITEKEKYQIEIDNLKQENETLKKRMKQLIQMVSGKNDD